LQILDVVVAAVVDEPLRNDPPGAPLAGNCYIVGEQPTGEWLGKQNELAAFTAAGWRFVAPTDGLSVHVRSSGTRATYLDGGWHVAQAIAPPTGGAVIDAEARASISAILAVLRGQGVIVA
jgi:hypothetical protein